MNPVTDDKAKRISRIATAIAELTEEQAKQLWHALEIAKLLSEAEEKESA